MVEGNKKKDGKLSVCRKTVDCSGAVTLKKENPSSLARRARARARQMSEARLYFFFFFFFVISMQYKVLYRIAVRENGCLIGACWGRYKTERAFHNYGTASSAPSPTHIHSEYILCRPANWPTRNHRLPPRR